MINDNHIDVARYRGEVRACEFCKNSTLPPPLRTHCKFCLINGWVAQCLKCDGTGITKGIAPWDGASEHGSTCDICGGNGVLPAKQPAEQPKSSTPSTPSTLKPETKVEVKPPVKPEIKDSKEKVAVVA